MVLFRTFFNFWGKTFDFPEKKTEKELISLFVEKSVKFIYEIKKSTNPTNFSTCHVLVFSLAQIIRSQKMNNFFFELMSAPSYRSKVSA